MSAELTGGDPLEAAAIAAAGWAWNNNRGKNVNQRAQRVSSGSTNPHIDAKFDCGGLTGACAINNPDTNIRIQELSDAVARDDMGQLVVTGGDSYYVSGRGSFSSSNGSFIRGRGIGSSHNSHRGVDIRGSALSLPRPQIDQYIEANSRFTVLPRIYGDGHIHLDW